MPSVLRPRHPDTRRPEWSETRWRKAAPGTRRRPASALWTGLRRALASPPRFSPGVQDRRAGSSTESQRGPRSSRVIDRAPIAAGLLPRRRRIVSTRRQSMPAAPLRQRRRRAGSVRGTRWVVFGGASRPFIEPVFFEQAIEPRARHTKNLSSARLVAAGGFERPAHMLLLDLVERGDGRLCRFARSGDRGGVRPGGVAAAPALARRISSAASSGMSFRRWRSGGRTISTTRSREDRWGRPCART